MGNYYENLRDSLLSQGKILGIDVSAVQGNIDWGFVASKYPWISFGILKCCDGNWVDPTFQANVKGLLTTSIKYFAYSVVHPNDAASQAQTTINAFNGVNPYCLLVDFETPYANLAQTTQTLQTMLATYQSALAPATQLGIYSYYGFIAPFIPALGNVKYAIANYSDINAAHPGIPDENVVIKQFSGWVGANGCKGMNGGVPCRNPNHNHGILLQLNAQDPGTPVDIDVIASDPFWQYVLANPY